MSLKPAIFARDAAPQRNPLNLLDLMAGINERLERVENQMNRLIEALADDPEPDEPPRRDLQGELLPREREPDEPL